MTEPLHVTVDGIEIAVDDPADSLLGVLRDQLGLRSAKDGCSPQGQCGCCTVLVDGAPRVACVTPVRRVRGREITTVDALPEAGTWAEALCATGGSQCGFCTPGIVVRLAALARKRPDADRGDVEQALLAHLCRCTGWQTVVDAWDVVDGRASGAPAGRDLEAAAARATLEGGTPQRLDPDVALGRGGFADDTAPVESLVAVLDGDGAWTLGESVAAARRAAGKVQGRRTTEATGPPLEVPAAEGGDGWAVTLRTSWVEPAYLETDASWAAPGVDPATPLANGGAFGAKVDSEVTEAADRLARDHDGPVRALFSREDTVRRNPKRPPLAAGLRADGTGAVRVVATPGIRDAILAVLPAVTIEEVDVAGPPTSIELRGAGWAEAVVLAEVLAGPDEAGWTRSIRQPGGGTARARIGDGGTIEIEVDAGDPLDEIALRSYVIGAAHQAAGWVTSEAITVDDDGTVHDLTIRSFGVLRAVDTPPIAVTIAPADDSAAPVAVSDAAFAAVATAVWRHQGLPTDWPTGIAIRPS